MSEPGLPVDDHPPTSETPDAEEESWPIGFMIIVTLVILYLGWRVIQAFAWVIEQI